jgi:hypothetical protein
VNTLKNNPDTTREEKRSGMRKSVYEVGDFKGVDGWIGF